VSSPIAILSQQIESRLCGDAPGSTSSTRIFFAGMTRLPRSATATGVVTDMVKVLKFIRQPRKAHSRVLNWHRLYDNIRFSHTWGRDLESKCFRKELIRFGVESSQKCGASNLSTIHSSSYS
jgi:hypothetical protein